MRTSISWQFGNERSRGELTNPDLPLHALTVLVPASLLDQVVLFERALERVLQAANLQLARVKVWVASRAPFVALVEFCDAVADRIGQCRGGLRQLGQVRRRL